MSNLWIGFTVMKLLSAGAAKILVNFINQKGVQGVLYGLLIILR
jgi:hypothetical protein